MAENGVVALKYSKNRFFISFSSLAKIQYRLIRQSKPDKLRLNPETAALLILNFVLSVQQLVLPQYVEGSNLSCRLLQQVTIVHLHRWYVQGLRLDEVAARGPRAFERCTPGSEGGGQRCVYWLQASVVEGHDHK